MKLLILIASIYSVIIPVPTSSMGVGLFGYWQTFNMTVDRQRINGCFFDFVASETYIMSKQYCEAKKCSFNSVGYDTAGRQLTDTSTINPGETIAATIQSSFTLGATNTTFNGPLMVGVQSKLNWACRVGFGTRKSNSNFVQQLTSSNLLDSNTVSYYTIKVRDSNYRKNEVS